MLIVVSDVMLAKSIVILCIKAVNNGTLNRNNAKKIIILFMYVFYNMLMSFRFSGRGKRRKGDCAIVLL